MLHEQSPGWLKSEGLTVLWFFIVSQVPAASLHGPWTGTESRN